MQQLIIGLWFVFRYRSTCFGHPYAHHQEPINCSGSLWFTYERGDSSAVGRGRSGRTDHGQQHCYHHVPTVNQRLQRQFDGLLMMGIIIPETSWSVSVRQSNKILRLIVASSWVFYLSDWRCTEPQTLNSSGSKNEIVREINGEGTAILTDRE